MTVSKTYRSDLIRTLHQRGFIYQATDLEALDAEACAGPVVAYLGFDATAPSLHVGSLVQIMLLRWLRHYGHKVLVLVGGGTTRIGDPTGKEESRPVLDASDIAHNTQSIQKTLNFFLDDAGDDVIMLDNYTWLQHFSYLETLRTYGRHLSVNRMLSFDSIKQRLGREQHLSFLEFNYMVLQAIDFVVLHQRYGCRLQMGGADQWGNIVCGVELGRKMGFPTLFGLTTPLLTTAQGHKMGKTASGAVWLSAERLSPYDYWQFWRNTHDADVGRFLRLFTDLPLDQIGFLESKQGQDLNDAKVVLADAATTLCHGAEVVPGIHRQAGRFFQTLPGEQGESLYQDNPPEPHLILSMQADHALMIAEILMRLGWVVSKAEARRMMRQGAVRLNDQVLLDEMSTLASHMHPEMIPEETVPSRTSSWMLSMGKKKHALIHIKD